MKVHIVSRNMSLFAAYSVVIVMFFHGLFVTMVMLKCKNKR